MIFWTLRYRLVYPTYILCESLEELAHLWWKHVHAWYHVPCKRRAKRVRGLCANDYAKYTWSVSRSNSSWSLSSATTWYRNLIEISVVIPRFHIVLSKGIICFSRHHVRVWEGWLDEKGLLCGLFSFTRMMLTSCCWFPVSCAVGPLETEVESSIPGCFSPQNGRIYDHHVILGTNFELSFVWDEVSGTRHFICWMHTITMPLRRTPGSSDTKLFL